MEISTEKYEVVVYRGQNQLYKDINSYSTTNVN